MGDAFAGKWVGLRRGGGGGGGERESVETENNSEVETG